MLRILGEANRPGCPAIRDISNIVAVIGALIFILVGSAHASPGELDGTFGVGGLVETDLGAISRGGARAAAIQSDGKILVVGESALVRYQPDGNIDLSFDGDGIVDDLGMMAHALCLQPDGRILVAGIASLPYGYWGGFGLVRFNDDGSRDRSFGDGGIVKTLISGVDEAFDVAIDDSGRIIAAGSTDDPPAISTVALTRYLPDGTLDTTFDEDGILVTGGLGDLALATAVAIQPDGKIVTTAVMGDDVEAFVLIRYLPTGALDPDFGEGSGIATIRFGYFTSPNALALQPDGRIVVAGIGASRFAVARFLPDGSADDSFDGDGKVTTTFYNENIEGATSIALQRDGRILVAGSVEHENDFGFALARYDSDGTLDLQFGDGGKVVTQFPTMPAGGRSWDSARDVAIQADGRIILAGGAGSGIPPCCFGLARYLDGAGMSLSLDIKPGSCNNPLNGSSQGVLPAAVLGAEDLDVSDIDTASLLLQGVAPIRWGYEDVAAPSGGNPCECTEAGPDGFLDLTLKFDTQDIVAALGSPLRRDRFELTLSGTLLDGTPFEARDCVVGVGKVEPDPIVGVLQLVLRDEIRARFRKVQYTIPTTADVTLTVYDVAGRPVKRLLHSQLAAGRHEVSWDTAGLSQGVYFYRLRAGGQETTARVVLVQ